MMKKIELSNPPPQRHVLIAWLKEAADGGVQPKGMRRLCLEAARALEHGWVWEDDEERHEGT